MQASAENQSCAIYCRISQDIEGEGLGVSRQRQDCLSLAERQGYTVIEEYTDNDISASVKAKKARPAYQRMLQDAAEGKFDVIVAYSNSRLTRRLSQLEDLIQLHEKHGTTINTVVSGQDDLSTADGRMVARFKATIDAAEAERIGERVSRQKRQRAEKGLPGGGRYRVFGYTMDWQLEPTESLILADAFVRVATGESVTSVFQDWNSKGYTTVAGSDFKHGTLKKLLTRPGYAGDREYKGEYVGKTSYPAIVDKITFESAQLKMKEAGWSNKGKGVKKYLLSGIVTCNECLHPMYGAISAGKDSYRCKKDVGGCGKVSMKIAYVDKIIKDEVMMRELNKPTTTAVPAHDYNAEIGAVEKRIAELQQAYKDHVLALVDLVELVAGERVKLAALVKRAAEGAQERFSDVFKPWEDWDAASVSAQRVSLSRTIKAVMVKPNNKLGSHAIDYTRLSILWVDGTTSTPEDRDLGNWTEQRRAYALKLLHQNKS